MANKFYTSSPAIGINFDEKRSTIDGPSFALGTMVPLISTVASGMGHFAMYVQASAVIGNSAYCTVDLSTSSVLATSVASGTSSGMCRNGSVAFAAMEFGWVFVLKTAFPQGDIPPNNPNP